jgi:hypothetical protein
MTDPEAILNALAAGLSVTKASEKFHTPVAEVRQLLRSEIEHCLDGARLREAWSMMDRRLAAIELKFYNRAIEGDGDVQAAQIFVKISERRATLAGLNAPSSHIVQVSHVPPDQVQTSTERIRAALDRLRESKQFRDNGEDIPRQPH